MAISITGSTLAGSFSASQSVKRSPDLARGQLDDAVMLVRQLHLALRAHHAVAFDAADLADADGGVDAGHIDAGLGDDDGDALARVGRAADDLLLALVGLHLADLAACRRRDASRPSTTLPMVKSRAAARRGFRRLRPRARDRSGPRRSRPPWPVVSRWSLSQERVNFIARASGRHRVGALLPDRRGDGKGGRVLYETYGIRTVSYAGSHVFGRKACQPKLCSSALASVSIWPTRQR